MYFSFCEKCRLYYYNCLNVAVADLVWSQCPVLGDEVDEGEGHREGAEQYVGHCQVSDEHVPGRQQNLNQTKP